MIDERGNGGGDLNGDCERVDEKASFGRNNLHDDDGAMIAAGAGESHRSR